MLKFLAIIAVIVLLAWLWTAFRRRLKFAFKVTALVYGIGAIVRLSYVGITGGINGDRLLELALVTLAFFACWLFVWAMTTLLARRRSEPQTKRLR